MSNLRIDVWGRIFDLEIIYDCFHDEKITVEQEKTLDEFLKSSKEILECAYIMIEKYCTTNFKNIVGDRIENIFKYVKPQSIYVKREKTSDRTIALLCKFKLDLEHGIAIVIKNEKVLEVGLQDIIL